MNPFAAIYTASLPDTEAVPLAGIRPVCELVLLLQSDEALGEHA